MDFRLRTNDWIADFFSSKQVPAVFHLSGGMTTFIIDAIANLGATPIINLRHEQAAGFAAGFATRATGRPAVAMGTSGPGATNLVTAIASCFLDSTPTIFVTGQANTSELRRNMSQRQNGFQELDIGRCCRFS
jgi:acetolactate synthase-1/2/3 large subunit